MAQIFTSHELVDAGKIMVIGEAVAATVLVEPLVCVRNSIEGREAGHIGGRGPHRVVKSIDQLPTSKLSWG